MRVLTSEEVQQAEQQALARPGMSGLVLLQRGGHAVAQFCAGHFKFRTVCAVCGHGKNGAYGLAAAEALRQLAENVSVIVLSSSAEGLDPDTAAFCAQQSQEPIWAGSSESFEDAQIQEALQADLIIDAITDSKPPLTPLQLKAIEAINDAFGTIVSVDVPSGVDADSIRPFHQSEQDAVFAHGIITFVAPRQAHVFGELTSGPIAVSEIGVQPALVSNATQLQVISGQEMGMAFPRRLPDAHKGAFGHVLVIAGSAGKAGAAALAGMAALRTGAGLVTVACPQSIQDTVAGFAPEMMTEALPETEARSIAAGAGEMANKLMTGKNAVVLGPGLSQHPETAEFIRALVQRCSLPLVLDADGINAFTGRASELKKTVGERFRVLTPHPGEAARLLGVSIKEIQADRVKMARHIATETGSCAVLKGWRSVVAGASGETWINMSGNAAMAKGGSGDVLCGIIAAALARQAATAEPTHPADNTAWQVHERGVAFLKDARVAAAVHLHGMAGDTARDELHENTVIARDVMNNLAASFHECEVQMERGLFYLQR